MRILPLSLLLLLCPRVFFAAPTIHLRFDEPSGSATFYDSTGNGRNATCTTCPDAAEGVFGRAASFNGTDDYVRILNSLLVDPTTSFTASFWLRANSGYGDTNNCGLASQKTDGWGGLWINVTNGFVWGRFIQSNGVTVNFNQNTAVPVGSWSHLVAVANAGTLTIHLYLNGVQIDSNSYDGTLRDASEDLTIGMQGGTENFGGLMDEVTFWNQALTAREVRRLYLRGARALNYMEPEFAFGHELPFSAQDWEQLLP